MENPPKEEIDQQFQKPKLEDTISAQCLDILLREYEIERGKRQSFESRAGIVMVALAALCIFAFEKVPILGWEKLVTVSSHPFLKVHMCILAYGSLIFSLLCLFNTLRIRPYQNFDPECADESLAGKPPLEGTLYLIKVYRNIIADHRKNNKKVAWSLILSMISLCVFLASVVVYINI